MLLAAATAGTWSARAVPVITGIKAVSQLPGANPRFRASVTVAGVSVIGGNWGKNALGTWQADAYFTGSGGGGTRVVDFPQWLTPTTLRAYNLEGRAVNVSGGGAVVEALASCAYGLSRSSQSFSAAGGIGTVSVTADGPTASFCRWTIAENADWVSILTGLEGAGAGAVAYQVDPNPCGARREATLVIAGMYLTVIQEADVPTVTISPVTRTHAETASGGHTITVSDPCGLGWSASAPANWVHITSGASGTGNGTVTYRVDANPSIQPRTATITVGLRSFIVVQQGIQCRYTVGRSAGPPIFTSDGGSGCLNVEAPAGCPWSAFANCGWVDISSGNSGSGNGTVCFDVAENVTTNDRTCAVIVAGQTYDVIQAAGPCQWSLSPASPAFFEFPREGGSGCVEVLTPSGCVWSVDNEASTWVQVTSGGSGVGSTTLCFQVQANGEADVRSGSLRVKDQVVNLSQSSGCTSPCGSEKIISRSPVFEWCPVEDATWHQIHINRNGKTYFSGWIEQPISTWIPDTDLPCGTYTWWVRSWGPDIGTGEWMPSCTFLIEDCCTPGLMTGLAPDGDCLQPGRIDYVWEAEPCASWYQLWVGRGGTAFHSTWFETGIVASGTVSRTVYDHVFGDYTWWLRGWGPDGMGLWTGPTAFSVGAPTPLGPANSTLPSPVTFVWDDACTAQAAWYQFWVNRAGKKHWAQWVPAADTAICAPGGVRCFGPKDLAPGNYTWWMRAWMPGGTGAWSEGVDFAVQ